MVNSSESDYICTRKFSMVQLKIPFSILFKLLLITLFFGYYSSITFFYHTHIIYGAPITHSHPFKLPDKKGPVNNHSHSTVEYILLHQNCDTSITDFILNTPLIPDQHLAFCFEFNSPYTYFFPSSLTTRESPRAPPVC